MKMSDNRTIAAINSADDGFGVFTPQTGSLIKGKVLRFKDDTFQLDGAEIVEIGSRFTVTRIVTAWVKWNSEKLVDTRITRSGETHPHRSTLGDDDQKLWPDGFDKKPQDPWRNTRYLDLVGADAQQMTFISSTVGGLIAVDDLRDQVALYRRARPGAVPVVELQVTDFKTKFGLKSRPKFEVVDWIEPTATAIATPAPIAPATAAKLTIVGEILNDSILFLG
jgi:hypothetical protein